MPPQLLESEAAVFLACVERIAREDSTLLISGSLLSFSIVAPFTHSMRLFDSIEARASYIAQFVSEGLSRGENVLIVALARNWHATMRDLNASGMSVAAAIAGGTLTVLDAEQTLAEIRPGGRLDFDKFRQEVATLVRRLAAQAPLRIYGEIVDELADRGEFRDAFRLETLWNELAGKVPFVLRCGYSSEHFANERSTSGLKAICLAHSHVDTRPEDLLGSFLLSRAMP